MNTARSVDTFKREAVAYFGNRIECLLLTGSHARDDAHAESDIDLWLFLDVVTMADLDAIGDLLESPGPGRELNVQCTSFAEFGRFSGAMNPLQLHLEGKLLHGSSRFDPPSTAEIRHQARRIAADVLMSARHYLTAREPEGTLAQSKLARFVLKPLMLALRYEARARTGSYPSSLDELAKLTTSKEARGLVDIRRRYLGAAFDVPCRPILRQAERVARALLTEDDDEEKLPAILKDPQSTVANRPLLTEAFTDHEFELSNLGDAPEARAPDGSRVRALLRTQGGSMAHFELEPGTCSKAVAHHRVDELWFVLSGRGEIWRAHNGREEISALAPGACFSIPHGFHFQFRASEDAPLRVVAVTMPPWPGPDEAYAVKGTWTEDPG